MAVIIWLRCVVARRHAQLPTGAGSASFIAATTQRSDRSLLVGGQRESSTSYLYDGVEMRNPRIGDSSITPSLDAVQEFTIQRNFFQAEFGNSPRDHQRREPRWIERFSRTAV